MAHTKLHEILEPIDTGGAALRWRATVPLATNPFLLLELMQFAFVAASVVLTVICIGVWLTDSALTPGDAISSLWMSCLVFLGVLAAFAVISIFFFGNRYYAVYQTDASGLYYEGSKGRDERSGLFVYPRAMPVLGDVRAKRTSGRHLPWEKIDRFQDFPSMRVIVLKRKFWHLMRLYTPDTETHAQVTFYLRQRLKKSS